MTTRYMTVEGHKAIQDEIDFLWSKERPEIVNQVTAAAELGDRSENAEYIYGKKRLREIDSRMRYLQKKIDGITVVDLGLMPAHKDVRFGAIVTVEEDDGQRTFRLVDQDESDPARRRISIQSPIGRALLGKKVGDYVEVDLPKDRISLGIIEIRYGKGEP